jgi:predicted transposase/invertase (TIGR01784 family)
MPTEAKTEALGQYTRFDWSMKRLLRNKADYVVLDGFLTALLGEEIKILSLLESEGNKETALSKSNRVDLLAQDSRKRKIIIEIQNTTELDYFHRMLFGTAKVVTDFIKQGDDYGEIGRIFSVSIVYFDLGHGRDYVYRGRNEFRGIHTDDVLELTELQLRQFPACKAVSDVFPEYFVLRVDRFDESPQNPLDEWIYFLKSSEIPETFNASGLKEARELLRVDRLTPEERQSYLSHLDALRHERSINKSVWAEGAFSGEIKGIAKGLAEGTAETNRRNALAMKQEGLPVEMITRVTGLPLSEIEKLAQNPTEQKS